MYIIMYTLHLVDNQTYHKVALPIQWLHGRGWYITIMKLTSGEEAGLGIICTLYEGMGKSSSPVLPWTQEVEKQRIEIVYCEQHIYGWPLSPGNTEVSKDVLKNYNEYYSSYFPWYIIQ